MAYAQYLNGAERRVLFYEYTAADAWPLGGYEPIDHRNLIHDRTRQVYQINIHGFPI